MKIVLQKGPPEISERGFKTPLQLLMVFLKRVSMQFILSFGL